MVARRLKSTVPTRYWLTTIWKALSAATTLSVSIFVCSWDFRKATSPSSASWLAVSTVVR